MLTGIDGTIKLVDEEGNQKIQLIIPENDFEKFKEYKNLDQDGKVIEKEFYARFMLNGKQLYITGHFEQQAIILETENEEVDVDSASSQPKIMSIPISSVITQDNEQLHDVLKMAEELGLHSERRDTEVELFKHHEIQNEAGEMRMMMTNGLRRVIC